MKRIILLVTSVLTAIQLHAHRNAKDIDNKSLILSPSAETYNHGSHASHASHYSAYYQDGTTKIPFEKIINKKIEPIPVALSMDSCFECSKDQRDYIQSHLGNVNIIKTIYAHNIQVIYYIGLKRRTIKLEEGFVIEYWTDCLKRQYIIPIIPQVTHCYYIIGDYFVQEQLIETWMNTIRKYE